MNLDPICMFNKAMNFIKSLNKENFDYLNDRF